MCINSKNACIVLAPTRSMAALAQLLAVWPPPLRCFACHALFWVVCAKDLTIEYLEGIICGRLSGKRFYATLNYTSVSHLCACVDVVFIYFFNFICLFFITLSYTFCILAFYRIRRRCFLFRLCFLVLWFICSLVDLHKANIFHVFNELQKWLGGKLKTRNLLKMNSQLAADIKRIRNTNCFNIYLGLVKLIRVVSRVAQSLYKSE